MSECDDPACQIHGPDAPLRKAADAALDAFHIEAPDGARAVLVISHGAAGGISTSDEMEAGEVLSILVKALQVLQENGAPIDIMAVPVGDGETPALIERLRGEPFMVDDMGEPLTPEQFGRMMAEGDGA